ncbi:MAG: septation protein A [Proteobacteria bacterium]|nr:septation protein A [Pseudomonadota bacterium]
MSELQQSRPRLSPLLKLALDIGPLFAFFAVLTRTDVYIATATFMVLVAGSLIVTYSIERRISPMLAISFVLVMIFGGLTLYLHNDLFVKLKPTIYYVTVAVILAAGLITRRNFLKIVLDQAFHLPEDAWRTLTWRWIGFFVLMAVMNEVVWRSFSLTQWASYKLFVALPLTLVFAIAQTPFMLKHQIEEKSPQG